MENCTMIISLLLGALNQSRFVDVDKKHERWEREQKRSMCIHNFFLKDFEFSTLNKTTPWLQGFGLVKEIILILWHSCELTILEHHALMYFWYR